MSDREPTTRLDAVLFDLDGVLTRTARVHLLAWTRVFNDFLARRPPRENEDLRPFAEADYRAHVDGRPRLDGIRAFLASRRIALPEGTPADAPDAETVHGLGRRKNERFRALLDELGVDVDPAARPLLLALRGAGVRVAICTSSRNARMVLERAGLDAMADGCIDGNESAALGLAGKPAPDIFLTCAERLRARPSHSAVLEDAAQGIEAARAGGFALVIGVDASGANEERLLAAGADWIVRDLSEVTLEELLRRLPLRARKDVKRERRGHEERGSAGTDDEASLPGGAP